MASSFDEHASLVEEYDKDPGNSNAQMRGVAWWPAFVRDLDERWKWKFATDDPKLPGTDESLIDWMLAQDNISDDVEALYPGIRAVYIRLGEHKFTPLEKLA